MAEIPVDFEEKAKTPPAINGTGYPYRISAEDLMRNFAMATMVVEDDWIDARTVGSHPGRKLMLPSFPSESGTQNLSVSDGSIGWSPGLPEPPSSGVKNLVSNSGNIEWSDGLPEPPSSGDYVLTSAGGQMDWMSRDDLKQYILQEITERLDNATIDASCDSYGSVTVTLNL